MDKATNRIPSLCVGRGMLRLLNFSYDFFTKDLFQIQESVPPSCPHYDHGTSYILYSFGCPQSVNLQGDFAFNVEKI